jgi:hypothetical protein
MHTLIFFRYARLALLALAGALALLFPAGPAEAQAKGTILDRPPTTPSPPVPCPAPAVNCQAP